MSLIRQERDGAVLRLILSDPSTRNALSESMIPALDAALTDVAQDVRVIVIASAGPVFSSGHNLKELTAHRTDADGGERYFKTIFDSCAAMMMRISEHRCAVIAEVDGLASAAGCQLVAACDLAYASPRATFCTPGVNIGLFCSTPMVPLSRAVAPKHAMEMLLTGDVVTAEFALRAGLINEVVPQNTLTSHVQQVASKIASKSGNAIAHGKRLGQHQSTLPLAKAYAAASAVMVENMLESSAIEGLGAFIEKRQPQWPNQN
jgi:enoyl-CoA hydratase/carnithine racemase